MNIGMIGLGKMGFNLSKNLINHGHSVVTFDTNKDITDKMSKEGGISAYSLKEVCGKLSGRKVIWIMVPNGAPVDGVITELLPLLNEGDIIIDGGNSNYKESVRRYKELKEKKESVDYEDVLKDIIERDNKDTTRKLNPLRKAIDATEVDTTYMSINEVINFIYKEIVE